MELKGSKTEQNLWAAFAGESQARNKYTYYASKAKKDGYVQIAKIFEELNWGDFTIRINSRRLLNGIFQALEIMDQNEILHSIDKIEKIGWRAVAKELENLRLR